MTEKQVSDWTKARDEAKLIMDPVARERALDIVYDMKDAMQLDCQRKMADRIKDIVRSDAELGQKIDSVEHSVAEIQSTLAADHVVVSEIRDHKLRAHGFMLALKWLGYLAAAGGGSAVTLLLGTVSKSAGS